MRDYRISVTTDGSGDGSTTLAAPVTPGVVMAIDYLPGSIVTGATITITDEVPGGGSLTLLVKASAGTSNVRFYPRVLKNLNTDGSTITGQYDMPLVVGKLKLLVASGGATKTGAVVVHLMDL